MELKVLVLFLWFCSTPVQSSVIRRYYWYHAWPMMWQEAQQSCKDAYAGDLATVVTDADLRDMDLSSYNAWIGLRKMEGTWEWVVTPEHYANLPENKKSMSLTVQKDALRRDCGRVLFAVPNVTAEYCTQRFFVFCEDLIQRSYFFNKSMTWVDGLNFCELQGKAYKDMFTHSSLKYDGSPVYQQQDFPVWIGQNHKDPGPNLDPGSGLCLVVSSQSKTTSTRNCSEFYPFLCYRNNLVLLKEELTWENALETCRNLKNVYNYTSFSLLSVEEDELEYVHSCTKGATTSKVWVGLRFLAGSWFWSNNASVTLPSLPSCPGLRLGCGALVFSSESGPVIEPTDCSEKLNAFCSGSGPQWS